MVFNALLIFTLVIAVLFMSELSFKHKQSQELYGMKKRREAKEKKKKNKKKQDSFLKKYRANIDRYMNEIKKPQYSSIVFISSIAFGVGLGAFIISLKQYLLGALFPILFLPFCNKLFEMIHEDKNSKIEEQLPHVIDEMSKVFSKYGDLKTVFYEVSQNIKEPLKSEFEDMSRKMTSGGQEEVLVEFGNRVDNIWVHSMVFILLSYTTSTTKEDVVVNLRHLSDIIDKENKMKATSKTENAAGVILNYMMAGLALVAGVMNALFNPIGQTFFFETTLGTICFVSGIFAILGTIMINLAITNRSKKEG